MAAQKKLEAGSKYAGFDKDDDGVVTDEEFEMEQKLIQLENEDKKQDAQRNMAWFALGGMLLYPTFVIAVCFFFFNYNFLFNGSCCGGGGWNDFIAPLFSWFILQVFIF